MDTGLSCIARLGDILTRGVHPPLPSAYHPRTDITNALIMTPLQRQIAVAHIDLILLVLAAHENPQQRTSLENRLNELNEDGWHALAHALRRRAGLPHDAAHDTAHDAICALDEEDRAILELIDEAQRRPAWFNEAAQQAAAQNVQHAAEPLAALVYAAPSASARRSKPWTNCAASPTPLSHRPAAPP